MAYAWERDDASSIDDPSALGPAAITLLQGLSALDIGIAVVDLRARRIVYLNHAKHRLSGYSDHELEQMDISDLVQPDNVEGTMSRIESLMAAGDQGDRGSHVTEISIRHKDGHLIPVEVISRQLMIEGRPHAVSVFRDITHRRGVEEYGAHVQKMEAIARLARGVAHDFNNLLGAIKNQCQLLAEEHLAPSVQQSIAEIEGVAEMGARIAEQLLDIARRQPSRRLTLDIASVLEESYSVLARLVGPGIELEVGGDGPALAIVDRARFEQLIINLVVNAREAMPDGGEVKVETCRRKIDPTEAARLRLEGGEYVVVQVSDTGKGIDPSDRSRIFEPFFTTKDASRAAGLGLATSYSTVVACGGAIDVTSDPGRGSTFAVYLPAARDEPASEV